MIKKNFFGGETLLCFRGYAQQHVVEGLEPRTTYRFRLKVTDPSGESAYSTPVCVTTTSKLAIHC